MLVKRYGPMKVAASSYYKQQRCKQASISSTHRHLKHQSTLAAGQDDPIWYEGQVHPSHRYAATRRPYPVPYDRYLPDYEDDDDDDDDEFAHLDQYPDHHGLPRGEGDDNRDRSKLIFILLVIPSLIALYGSNNKMNKNSDSNVDIDALKAGQWPGFSHGAAGNSFKSMMDSHHHHHHRHLPEFEEDELAHMVAAEHDETRRNSGKAKSSTQKYAEKLMADFPGAKNPAPVDNENEEEADAESSATHASGDSASEAEGEAQPDQQEEGDAERDEL